MAMTRAEEALYLSEAGGRNFDGSPRYPSRFLLDIAQELLTYTAPPEESLIREARDYVLQSKRYLPASEPVFLRSGQRVRHAQFGLGTVVEADPARQAHLIQFDDMPTPRRISLRAKLEALE